MVIIHDVNLINAFEANLREASGPESGRKLQHSESTQL